MTKNERKEFDAAIAEFDSAAERMSAALDRICPHDAEELEEDENDDLLALLES